MCHELLLGDLDETMRIVATPAGQQLAAVAVFPGLDQVRILLIVRLRVQLIRPEILKAWSGLSAGKFGKKFLATDTGQSRLVVDIQWLVIAHGRSVQAPVMTATAQHISSARAEIRGTDDGDTLATNAHMLGPRPMAHLTANVDLLKAAIAIEVKGTSGVGNGMSLPFASGR